MTNSANDFLSTTLRSFMEQQQIDKATQQDLKNWLIAQQQKADKLKQQATQLLQKQVSQRNTYQKFLQGLEKATHENQKMWQAFDQPPGNPDGQAAIRQRLNDMAHYQQVFTQEMAKITDFDLFKTWLKVHEQHQKAQWLAKLSEQIG